MARVIAIANSIEAMLVGNYFTRLVEWRSIGPIDCDSCYAAACGARGGPKTNTRIPAARLAGDHSWNGFSPPVQCVPVTTLDVEDLRGSAGKQYRRAWSWKAAQPSGLVVAQCRARQMAHPQRHSLTPTTHAFIGQDSIVPRIGSTTGIDARGLASLIGTRSTLEDTVSSTRVRTRLSVVGTHFYLR